DVGGGDLEPVRRHEVERRAEIAAVVAAVEGARQADAAVRIDRGPQPQCVDGKLLDARGSDLGADALDLEVVARETNAPHRDAAVGPARAGDLGVYPPGAAQVALELRRDDAPGREPDGRRDEQQAACRDEQPTAPYGP